MNNNMIKSIQKMRPLRGNLMTEKYKFVLNEYHRDVSDEELLEDIRLTARRLNVDSLTSTQYPLHGKYHSSTICRRFGSWNKALDLAGLTHAKEYSRNIANIAVSNQDLLDDLIMVAQKLSKDSVTTNEYENIGQHGYKIFIYRFSTWDNALSLAGLKPTGFHHVISDEDLLTEIARLWIELGRQPTSTDIRNGASKYSLNSYTRRFGGWRKALEFFVSWVSSSDGNSPDIELHGDMSNPIQSRLVDTGDTIISPKRKTSREINYRMRFKVMQRDNFRCCICGASPAKDPNIELQIDHVVPWSKGGETTIDNLQTLCRVCNLGKSDLFL